MIRNGHLVAVCICCVVVILTGYTVNTARSRNSTSAVVHSQWSYQASIYEVNIRQYTQEGTFKAFEQYLPEIKAMGIDIIWLMPIHPIGQVNRKGGLGSYYSVADYLAVNPEFGTQEDFRDLVKKIHQLGMYVIIDWVANHTAWDHVWIKSHPDYFSRDSKGNLYPPFKDWSDVVDLNYENRELWKSMTDALVYWVKEFDIDGYRCDVAAMVPTSFWDQAREQLDKIKPVFMLAEAYEPELHLRAFDMTYNWQFKDLMIKIAAGKKKASDFWSLYTKQKSIYPDNSFQMNFITNHDENTWNGTVSERLGNGAEAFNVLITLVEGMPLIYSGQEAGLNKRLQFFDRDPIEWKDHKLRDLLTRLLHLKKENNALWNGSKGSPLIRVSNQRDILAFVRCNDTNKIFAIFNLSDHPQTVELKHPQIQGEYCDLFSQKKCKIESSETLELSAWQYQVYYTPCR